MRNFIGTRALGGAAAAAMLLAGALPAQNIRSSSARERSDVSSATAAAGQATIILVDRLPHPSSKAMVVRFTNGNPINVVLVTRDAEASDLARGIAAVMQSRTTQGYVPARELRAYISRQAGRAGSAADLRRASADLMRLRSAPVFSIPGLAAGRAITVRLRTPVGRGGTTR